MKIKQVLNNNIVLAAKGTMEVIVFGKGIGFNKKVGDTVGSGEYEKVFVQETHESLEHLSYLLGNMPEEQIRAVGRIIELAETVYGEKINPSVHLTLIDHISFAIRRTEQGMSLKSPLAWEIKKFYKDEYAIGEKAVRIIREETGVKIDDDEAASIALHFVNNQFDRSIGKISQISEIVQNILNILQYYLRKEFDENSFHYQRFIKHLQYLAQKITDQDSDSENNDVFLYQQVSGLYPQAFNCAQKVKAYIFNTFQVQLSKNDEAFLIVHIQNMIRNL